MDPVTGAIVAIILWLLFIGIGEALIVLVLGVIGTAVLGEAGGMAGIVLGWLLGVAWAAFALIQAILQFVHLLQLWGVVN